MAIATLLIVQGRDQGERYTLRDESISLGRGTDSEFRILDGEVSRRHAYIKHEGSHFVLVDNHSSNGSFVNGRNISEQTLSSGDQIQLGRTVLLFEVDSSHTSLALTASGQIDLVVDSLQLDQSQIVSQFDPDPSQSLLIAPPQGGAGNRLEALYQISELATSPTTGLDELLQKITDLTLSAVSADRGCMLVADAETDEIRPRVFSRRGNLTAVQSREKMPISTTIVQYVLANGKGIQTSDARLDERFASGQSILKVGIREAMCVPLQGRYELLGVLYVDTTQPFGEQLQDSASSRFSRDTLELLSTIARQAALAVEGQRYQTALVKAERLAAVGQTVASISHDIKNILQGMSGGSFLVKNGLKKDDREQISKGWAILDRNQNRIMHLVTDMLTFSKERRPELRMCDLNDVVREVAELMQPTFEERGRSLSVDYGDLPPTAADPEAMHRAVLNFATNGLEALNHVDDGRLDVRTHVVDGGDTIEIVVADNGPGIPAEERPKLFSLFESDKGMRGTGLGLAVSLKILKEHGGSITVDDDSSSGATFRLRIPVQTAPQRVESKTQPGI